jgi:hypothetical protein
LEESRVAVVPGNESGFDIHVRPNFAISMEQIEEGIAVPEEDRVTITVGGANPAMCCINRISGMTRHQCGTRTDLRLSSEHSSVSFAARNV